MQNDLNLSIDRQNDAINSFFSKPNKGSYDRWLKLAKNIPLGKKKEKKDYALDIIYFAFFSGLILVVLSMVNFFEL